MDRHQRANSSEEVAAAVDSLIKEVGEIITVGEKLGVNLADHVNLVRTAVMGEGGNEGML